MIFRHVCARAVDQVVEHFVLVAENVVVDVEHFRRLTSQDERLHETTHWTHVVGQLTGHLNTTTEIIISFNRQQRNH